MKSLALNVDDDCSITGSSSCILKPTVGAAEQSSWIVLSKSSMSAGVSCQAECPRLDY